MRHLLQPQAEDASGNALAGVTYKVYPHATAKAALTQDANAVWGVTTGSLPAEATIYASDDPGVNTALASMESKADGSTVAGYLDSGLYVLIGTVGARNFVVPLFEAGTIITVALGTTVAANDDLNTALGKMVVKLEALEAIQAAHVEANVTLITDLGNNMPTPVGTIPASVSALSVTAYGGAEVVKVEHTNGYVHYTSDGTTWSEAGRVVTAATASDPLTMTFTV